MTRCLTTSDSLYENPRINRGVARDQVQLPAVANRGGQRCNRVCTQRYDLGWEERARSATAPGLADAESTHLSSRSRIAAMDRGESESNEVGPPQFLE